MTGRDFGNRNVFSLWRKTEKDGADVIFRLRNDLYCVEWDVKLYSLTHSLQT